VVIVIYESKISRTILRIASLVRSEGTSIKGKPKRHAIGNESSDIAGTSGRAASECVAVEQSGSSAEDAKIVKSINVLNG